MFFDRQGDCSGGHRAETRQICPIGLTRETKEILKSSASMALPQFFLAAMNTLRPVSLACLMPWSLVPVMLAGLLAGSVLPCFAAEPAELAVRQLARESRIVLDLSKRQITLVRGEQRLGAWPVAIGDPKTPTPKGEFAILNKKVNPNLCDPQVGSAAGATRPQQPDWRSIHGLSSQWPRRVWDPRNGLAALGSDSRGRQPGLRAHAQQPHPAAV